MPPKVSSSSNYYELSSILNLESIGKGKNSNKSIKYLNYVLRKLLDLWKLVFSPLPIEISTTPMIKSLLMPINLQT